MEYQTGIVLLSVTMRVLEYWFGEAHNEFSRVVPLLISSPDVFHIFSHKQLVLYLEMMFQLANSQ